MTLPLQWGKGVGEGEKVRRKEGRTIRSQQSGTNHSSRSAGRFYFPWTGRRELTTNPDLLAELAPRKANRVLIGFAAETSDHLQEAHRKLEGKGLDVIYVNDVSGGAIFGQDTTMGTILLRNEADIAIKEVSKDALSNVLLDHALRQLG